MTTGVTMLPAMVRVSPYTSHCRFRGLDGVWYNLPSPNKRPTTKHSAYYPLRALIFHRDDYKCVRCGENRFYYLLIDHLWPFNAMGGHAPWNLQLLCRRCNTQKGSTIPTEREINDLHYRTMLFLEAHNGTTHDHIRYLAA